MANITSGEPAVGNPPVNLMDRRLLKAAKKGDVALLQELLSEPEELVDAAQSDVQANDRIAIAIIDGSEVTPSNRVPTLLQGVTYEGDSVLHIVASFQDARYLNFAEIICHKAKSLLAVPNKVGDMPLHCAARAGHIQMVHLLISHVETDAHRSWRLFEEWYKKNLGATNRRGETALHEAVRYGHTKVVRELISMDDNLATLANEHGVRVGNRLACIVDKDGVSPLYLAATLQKLDIVKILIATQDGSPSFYVGPNGQTALHAAVLRNKELTSILLQWNKELTKAADKDGSTPLHFLATAGGRDIARLLLDADPSCAYCADSSGSLPIHCAAMMGKLDIIRELLRACPDCDGLRDANGRSFLHVAVEYRRSNVVRFICREQKFSEILNMRDSDGNTALHLAVKIGYEWTFFHLVRNKEVQLSFTNNEGLTPRDLATAVVVRTLLYFSQNPLAWMNRFLATAGAQHCISKRGDRETYIHEEAKKNTKDEQKLLTKLSQTLLISSVLITTITFAAIFTMPGGYRGDDQTNEGMPTLAKKAAFKAFIMFDTIAFVCSALATGLLMQAGLDVVDPQIRVRALATSLLLMDSAMRSMLFTFLFGACVVLAPVTRWSAAFVGATTCVGILFYQIEAMKNSSIYVLQLLPRGVISSRRIVYSLLLVALLTLLLTLSVFNPF